MSNKKHKLLTVGHSYCVSLNRLVVNEMTRIGSKRWEITAVAPDSFPGDLAPLALKRMPDEAVGLRGVPVHFASKIHAMLYGQKLRKILEEEWDIVHCWEEPYILAAAQVARWTRHSTPFVFYTFQNLSKRYPPPFNWIENYNINRCSAWLTGAYSVEDTLLKRGYGRRPHAVIPLAVDQSLFKPQSHLGMEIRRSLGWDSCGPPVIGFLGRFTAPKGLEFLTHVLDSIQTPWRALFVGGGELEGWLRRWAGTHNGRVQIVTGIPHGGVPSYLNAMDLLCAPSQTAVDWREQFGRMIIEAFACGLPVIASDSGEIPYVLGDAGILLSETDFAGWVDAVQSLLRSENYRRDLSVKGLDRVEREYSIKRVAERHLEFFEHLLIPLAT